MTDPTPGPWKVDPRAANHVIAESRSICSISYSDTSRPEETRLENEANARLIAAAPDLLEALTTCHAAAEGLKDSSLRQVIRDTTSAAISRTTTPGTGAQG